MVQTKDPKDLTDKKGDGEDISLTTQTEMEQVQSTTSRVDEYFTLKDTLKTLRADLKEHKENHIDYDELKEVSQKAKELRDNIKHDEDINIIQEKASQVRERMDMLKEIIKMELIENDQVEIKQDGKKLKIVQTLKEMKDNDVVPN